MVMAERICVIMKRPLLPGAQTKRRAGYQAGAGLLGGGHAPAAFLR
jgi:hypothetical protein